VARLTCALGPDSAGTLLTRFLRDATHRLDAACYEVGPAYRWALADAARRGTAVRLLLDGHRSDGNAATAWEVQNAGGRCGVVRHRRCRAHWKLLVADAHEVALGTGNLIWRDAPRDVRGRVPPDASALRGTREWWVFVSGSRWVAAHARARIGYAWRTAGPAPITWEAEKDLLPGDVGIPQPEVAPLHVRLPSHRLRLLTGGDAVAATLHELIERAQRRVLITTPYVSTRAARVRPLLHDLTAASRRGVDVQLLLGAPAAERDKSALRALGLTAYVMDVERSTRGHAKGIIADDVVMVSSANWSDGGFGANWEAAFVVAHRDAACYYADAWTRDREVATPL